MLSCIYNTTRRGLACVAYPYLGAMRRPDCKDRRGGTNSHVFFISIIFTPEFRNDYFRYIVTEQGEHWKRNQ